MKKIVVIIGLCMFLIGCGAVSKQLIPINPINGATEKEGLIVTINPVTEHSQFSWYKRTNAFIVYIKNNTSDNKIFEAKRCLLSDEQGNQQEALNSEEAVAYLTDLAKSTSWIGGVESENKIKEDVKKEVIDKCIRDGVILPGMAKKGVIVFKVLPKETQNPNIVCQIKEEKTNNYITFRVQFGISK